MSAILATYLWLICLISIIMAFLPMLLWNLELFYVSIPNDVEKLSAYECGFEPFDLARSLIDIQFYIVAILFLVFDIEVIFLLPWAVTLPQLATVGFWSMIIFICILFGGLVYEINSGALAVGSYGILNILDDYCPVDSAWFIMLYEKAPMVAYGSLYIICKSFFLSPFEIFNFFNSITSSIFIFADIPKSCKVFLMYLCIIGCLTILSLIVLIIYVPLSFTLYYMLYYQAEAVIGFLNAFLFKPYLSVYFPFMDLQKVIGDIAYGSNEASIASIIAYWCIFSFLVYLAWDIVYMSLTRYYLIVLPSIFLKRPIFKFDPDPDMFIEDRTFFCTFLISCVFLAIMSFITKNQLEGPLIVFVFVISLIFVSFFYLLFIGRLLIRIFRGLKRRYLSLPPDLRQLRVIFKPVLLTEAEILDNLKSSSNFILKRSLFCILIFIYLPCGFVLFLINCCNTSAICSAIIKLLLCCEISVSWDLVSSTLSEINIVIMVFLLGLTITLCICVCTWAIYKFISGIFKYILKKKKSKHTYFSPFVFVYNCNSFYDTLWSSESIIILLWVLLFVSLILTYFWLNRNWANNSKKIIILFNFISSFFLFFNIFYSYITYTSIVGVKGQMFVFQGLAITHLMQNDIYKIAQIMFACVGLLSMQLVTLHIINYKSLHSYEFSLIFITLFASLHIVAMAHHVLVIVTSIEIVSLSLFILIGQTRLGLEAALKYFVFSAFTTIFFLLGLFFVYLLIVYLDYEWLDASMFNDSILQSYIPCVMLISAFLVGFFFKLAAFPCSMWAPDVYEGSINAITFILATLAKIGFFSGFIQLIIIKLWILVSISQILLVLSITGSLITGAFGGLRQDNIKRSLAFTSMHHVGFMLSSLNCESAVISIQYSFIYLIVYIIGLAGFFSIYLLVSTVFGNSMTYFIDIAFIVINTQVKNHFSSFFGLFYLIIYLLSMAGMPPFAGFFSKYLIFLLMVKKNYIILFILSLMTSFISIFNYLRVIKIILLSQADFNFISTIKGFRFNFIWFFWTDCRGVFFFFNMIFLCFQVIFVGIVNQISSLTYISLLLRTTL